MKRGKTAFTRLELLVVLGVLGAFAFLALPAGARSKSQADVGACLEHNRQLVAAWVNFALDNDDMFATTMTMPMLDLPGLQPWAYGSMNWTPGYPDNTNSAYLTDPRYSVLADYLGRRREPFKCPADVFLSSGQRSLGWTERVRSVAGNAMLGWGTDDTWNSNPEDPYVRARKFADLVRPGPSLTFVFIEEHPDSLNDCGYFGPGRGTNSLQWYDYVGNYHDGAGMLSFADGRAELHAWRGFARTMPTRYNFGGIPFEAGQRDQRWVFERIPKKQIQ